MLNNLKKKITLSEIVYEMRRRNLQRENTMKEDTKAEKTKQEENLHYSKESYFGSDEESESEGNTAILFTIWIWKKFIKFSWHLKIS